jgi:hypothetical protein
MRSVSEQLSTERVDAEAETSPRLDGYLVAGGAAKAWAGDCFSGSRLYNLGRPNNLERSFPARHTCLSRGSRFGFSLQAAKESFPEIWLFV